MKILLVQSYLGRNEPLVFPLGFACLKSSLIGHQVKAFDMNSSERPFVELKEVTSGFRPDVTGISLRNIDSTNKRKADFYYRFLKDTVDAIRSKSDGLIIIGGSGFSMYAREIMEDQPEIDYGVYLEGETTLPKLIMNLNSPESVLSVYYRKNGNVLFSGPGSVSDLNCLNMPCRGIFPASAYKTYNDAMGVETKRGCMLNCIYCVYPFLNGREYRLKKAESVVDEIEQMLKDQGVDRFMFVDSVFNIPIRHAEGICREMIKRRLNVKWHAWFNERNLTKEFLGLVKAAGCDNVMLSPDGFSDHVLKALGKNLSTKDILRVFRMLKEMNGVEISYNFFKNPPGQNLHNFISLVLFFGMAKLALGRRVHFEFNSLRIEPFTKLFDIALKEGVVKKGESLLFPRYYTNKKTAFIEKLFNLMLRMKGQ